ncbi:LysR substrate-binding domain-containing protein [Pseudohaliea sp.]|uniref:LysR substrate-binding domain-containing protein n=1 Tax=Pseudohaliea sp. TaxID=2740289 RepID=UPI0032EBD139
MDVNSSGSPPAAVSSRDRRLLPLNGLRHLEVLARCGTLQAAARELGVTHGAVSRQLRLLEERAGAQLVDRQGRRLQLTAAGRTLAARLGQVFDDLGDTLAVVAQGQADARLRIGSTPSVTMTWLLRGLESFRRTRPTIELELVNLAPASTELPESLDLAVTFGSPMDARTRRIDTLYRENLLPVASPELLARFGAPKSPAEILTLPLIHDRHRHWQRWSHQEGVDLPEGMASLYVTDAYQAIEAARLGLGVALADGLEIAEHARAGKLTVVSERGLSGDRSIELVSRLGATRRDASVGLALHLKTFIREQRHGLLPARPPQ